MPSHLVAAHLQCVDDVVSLSQSFTKSCNPSTASMNPGSTLPFKTLLRPHNDWWKQRNACLHLSPLAPFNADNDWWKQQNACLSLHLCPLNKHYSMLTMIDGSSEMPACACVSALWHHSMQTMIGGSSEMTACRCISAPRTSAIHCWQWHRIQLHFCSSLSGRPALINQLTDRVSQEFSWESNNCKRTLILPKEPTAIRMGATLFPLQGSAILPMHDWWLCCFDASHHGTINYCFDNKWVLILDIKLQDL